MATSKVDQMQVGHLPVTCQDGRGHKRLGEGAVVLKEAPSVIIAEPADDRVDRQSGSHHNIMTSWDVRTA